ncbi:putative SNARE complex subunit [Taphrina deformans PYCC 5710]|uniref:SNARE complex subunit n=1 Tax=Taphrina deformans (strain PYCC 5710 / ATCC 11124 / CBS 356.35 / IMI 108563 / JCM 9778 / NBRC 8474) TaxID=1097556 RepID=R4X7C2_TAPDE|nr:putative SNARE complex subunit [Taphrina deformans PYCC 5710]|eukprot:CCG81242.1 putative SNARE complex subunit [Taphrina deformans PYCC 5710]
MSGKLRLLSEQLKISILERNRLLALDIKPTDEDEEELSSSLQTLSSGIKALAGNGTAYRSDAFQDELSFLKQQYRELQGLYKEETPEVEGQTIGIVQSNTTEPYRDEPDLDREALLPMERSRKSVRFTDTLVDAGLRDRDLLQMQTQIMEEQDNSLEHLSSSIGRQRELSIQIGNELDEHGELLDDMSSRVDRSTSRLDQAKQRLTKFSRKAKGNSHLLTIFVLIIILVLLLAIL